MMLRCNKASPRALIQLLVLVIGWGVACDVRHVASAAVPEARERQLTLHDALDLAQANNNRAQRAREQMAAAAAQRKSVRGKLGPAIDLDGSVTVWDKALEVSFEDMLQGGAGESNGGTGAGAAGALEPVSVRDQVTTQLSVTATQQIAAQVFGGYHIVALQEQAVRDEASGSLLTVSYDAIQSYIRLKQTLAGAEITRAALRQVEAQLNQGQALFRAGSIDRNDLLKLELAVARAEASVIEAESRVRVAQSALALTLGLPYGTALEPSEAFADPPPSFSRTLDECMKQARRYRPELRAARTTVEIADTFHSIAKWDYAPQLTALASYQNVQGQGFLAPKNSYFVGGTLKWNLWEWGGTHYRIQQRAHEAAQAKAGVGALENQVELEVQQSHSDLEVAERTLAVARKAVTQAEEAYRIEQMKYAQQMSSTLELVDAQLSLTLAKLTMNNALHQWYLAGAALSRAMGEPVAESIFGDRVQ